MDASLESCSNVLPITHVFVMDGIVTIAYLERGTAAEFADHHELPPMDDAEITGIVFSNRDPYEFKQGETFTLVDKVSHRQWICQVVFGQLNETFVARVVPIPPLETYTDGSTPTRRPSLQLVVNNTETD